MRDVVPARVIDVLKNDRLEAWGERMVNTTRLVVSNS
jgi:hypothetical protein